MRNIESEEELIAPPAAVTKRIRLRGKQVSSRSREPSNSPEDISDISDPTPLPPPSEPHPEDLEEGEIAAGGTITPELTPRPRSRSPASLRGGQRRTNAKAKKKSGKK